MDCLFCKIASNELKTTFVYEDEHLLAFNDINPQAPLHQLIIPRKHIATINETTDEHTLLIGQMVQTARQLAKENKVHEKGYRLVFNVQAGAGQTVFHIHLHLLAGRSLRWPPG